MKPNQFAKGLRYGRTLCPIGTNPECRCIDADRACRGYTDVFVFANVVTAEVPSSVVKAFYLTPPPSRSPSPVSNSSELRALHYYQVEVSRLLGGAVDPSFWTKSVLQLSESEPAIKHALMAISTEWEYKLHPNVLNRDESHQRSILAYSKALNITTQRLGEPEADTVALATCVLFLCLHCLQGDKSQAVKFLHTGSGVMLKVLQNSNVLLQDPESSTSIFLPIFERLVVLLRLFGVVMPSFRTPEKALYDLTGNFRHLNTLDEARSVLYLLVAESHELILQTRSHRLGQAFGETKLQEYLRRQEEQLAAYSAWLQEFERLCAMRLVNTATNTAYVAMLRVVHAVTVFWVSTCLDRYEALCDNYNDNFETIIRNAKQVVAFNNTFPHGSLPFTFEMGIIPPVYLTVLKCREPSLRHEALSLLSRAPEREGLWRREETLRVARRVFDLESKEFEILADGTLFRDARVCDIQTKFSDDLGTHVTVSAKLYGSDQTWKEWDEIIPRENAYS